MLLSKFGFSYAAQCRIQVATIEHHSFQGELFLQKNNIYINYSMLLPTFESGENLTQKKYHDIK